MLNSNIPIKIFIIILFFTSFLSCKRECKEDGSLTPDESAWISYVGGEQLIFRSNLGDTNYVTVDNVEIYFSPIGEDGNCPRTQQNKLVTVSPFQIAIRHGYAYWSGISEGNMDPFFFKDYPSQNNIVVNGNSFNNVFVMTKDTTGWYPASKSVWKIFYTRQNGILKYFVTGGTAWEKIN